MYIYIFFCAEGYEKMMNIPFKATLLTENADHEPVEDVGLELFDKLGPAQLKLVGVNPKVAQSDTDGFREALHHLYHVVSE